MNERIKELERQADEYADGLGLAGDEWCDAQSTKSAELLIKKCGEIAVFGDPRYSAQHNIHAYFGVE